VAEYEPGDVVPATEDPIQSGLRFGKDRLSRHGIYVPSEQVQSTVDRAVGVLGQLAEGAPPRAVELFVENVFVAAALRVKFEEPPLGDAEVFAFYGVARWFFNSLWHDEL
jgi:hypothetical protein